MIGNGVCNAVCNNFVCGYDRGDCCSGTACSGDLWSGITAPLISSVCAPGCYAVLTGNRQCDQACNNEACGWDGGECCGRPYAQSRGANFWVRTYDRALHPNSATAYYNSSARTVNKTLSLKKWPYLIPSVRTSVLDRQINVFNHVLGGVLVNQKRAGYVYCPNAMDLVFVDKTGYENLFPSCRSETDASTSYYGVDPVYLSSSSMYNVECCSTCTQGGCGLYNPDDAEQVNLAAKVPYGFHQINGPDEEFTGYPVFYDINFLQSRANSYTDYMEKGFYLDIQSQYVEVFMLTYNPQYVYFTLIKTKFIFEEGGKTQLEIHVDPFPGNPYMSQADAFRLSLEIVFVLMLLGNLIGECTEMYNTTRKDGFYDYLGFWNFLDWTAMLLLAAIIYVWIGIATKLSDYHPERRYNIFQSYDNTGGKMAPANLNATGVKDFYQMYYDADIIASQFQLYMALNMASTFLFLFRMLKLLDFQPRLGAVTRTLWTASNDLLHFFFILGLILGIFIVSAYYTFATGLYEFSTFPKAVHSSFYLMLGDTGVMANIVKISPLLGTLFCYTFIMIIFFILLNILLSILIEAYMKVNEQAEKEEVANGCSGMPAELFGIMRSAYRSTNFGRLQEGENAPWLAEYHMQNKEILEALNVQLEGDDDEAPKEEIMHDTFQIQLDAAEMEGQQLSLASSRKSVIKALGLHPETAHLDATTKFKIACSIVYRFGVKEECQSEEEIARSEADKAFTRDWYGHHAGHTTDDLGFTAPVTAVVETPTGAEEELACHFAEDAELRPAYTLPAADEAALGKDPELRPSYQLPDEIPVDPGVSRSINV